MVSWSRVRDDDARRLLHPCYGLPKPANRKSRRGQCQIWVDNLENTLRRSRVAIRRYQAAPGRPWRPPECSDGHGRLRACVSCVGDACVHACVHAGCMRTVLIQLPVLSQLTGRESAIVSWIEILRGEFREFRGLKFCGAGGGAVFIAGDGPP